MMEAKWAKNRLFWPQLGFAARERWPEKSQQTVRQNLCKNLILNDYFSRGGARCAGLPWSGSNVVNCVFFTQQSIEKRHRDLWEGRFFIARQTSFDNVLSATEGGIPVSRCPVHGSLR
jgi:hypothetical protein